MVSPTDPPVPEKPEFQRLPKNVIPIRYELFIELNFKTAETFNGITTLHARVTEETNIVQLNAVNLEILEVSYEQTIGGEKHAIAANKTEIDKENQILSIYFEEPLIPGEASFNILYTGKVAETKKGFFKSKYTSKDGDDRYAFATHFEPDMARSCFPCMDEPALKATFQLSLVVPKNRVGLSNMPVLQETDHEENSHYKIMKFETSPIMSTYLAAFAIGEYDFVEAITKNGVKVRTYVPVGKKSLGEYGLHVAAKSLDFYEDYFGVAYPLPKLDLVPLAEFSSGAMENWGMITFREERLVVDAQQTSALSKQSVALTVAHEVSHQWFGNLVTMEWWTELWLNEGYATFVEFLAVNHLFPEYDIWSQFTTDVLIPALSLDALSSSHPVEVEIKSPADCSEVFDTISYCKGASIIRMLQTYMGDEKFRAGMKEYLTNFQYRNAKTVDLWSALEKSSGLPVTKVMNNWTSQVGFPLVKIAEATQTGTGRSFLITQEKFCADAKYNKIEFDDFKWIIPLSVTQASNPGEATYTTLFDGSESQLVDISVPNVAPGEWVKFNAGLTGFYRVHYSSDMLKEFLPAIRDKSMNPLDRLGLLDDLFAVVQCGDADTVEVLNLLKAYTNEVDYTVWSAIQSVVSTIQTLLGFTDFTDLFKVFVRDLYTAIKEQVGWDAQPGESHLTGMLRSLVLIRMVSAGDVKTIAEAKERFDKHVKQEVILPADLRAAVYRGVLLSSDPTASYEALIKLYRESDLAEEKVRILRALGTVKEAELMDRVLEFSQSDEVKAQDMLSILYNMSTSPLGMRKAWDFFKSNVEIFKTKFVGQAFSRFIKALVEDFATEEAAVEVEDFFKANPVKGTARSVQQGVESIRNNVAWLKRDSKSIQAYLSAPKA